MFREANGQILELTAGIVGYNTNELGTDTVC
jgi:hypothetical protein